MGRQAKGKEPPMRLSPKALSRLENQQKKGGDCLEELNSYITCLATMGTDTDEKCAASKHALAMCTSAAARRPKVLNTINFHLQRISRLMK